VSLHAIRLLKRLGVDINDGGWDRLADRAAAAGYDRRVVLRYRGKDTMTATNIAAAYKQGWIDALDAAENAMTASESDG
jgi:hypothetical protein